MKKTTTLYLSAIIAMVLGFLCPQRAEAQQTGRYISEICVATHKDAAKARKLLEDNGYEVLMKGDKKDDKPGDFNAGAGGNYVYLGFKRTDDIKEAIVDLLFHGVCPEGRSYKKYKERIGEYLPADYSRIPFLGNSGNFNDGLNSKFELHLYYKKNVPLSGAKALTELKYSNSIVGDVVTGIIFFLSDGGYFQVDYACDTNDDEGGDYVFLVAPYHKHLSPNSVFVKDGKTIIGHEDCYEGEGCYYYTYNGKGTEAEPMEIESKGQMLALLNCVAKFPDMLNKYYKLTADIDFEGNEGFLMKDKFTGVFDGNGHTIRNLITDADHEDCALFKQAEGATFKNLTLENCTFGKLTDFGTRGGSVCCYSKNCRFENINVVNGLVHGSEGAGGIAFEMDGGVMTNCHVSGTVHLTDGHDIGGLVGSVLHTTAEATTIENCSTDGLVDAAYTGEKPELYVGGLFGRVTGRRDSYITIRNCHNLSHVLPVLQNSGGIAAMANYVMVDKCWNGGLVETYKGNYGGGLFAEVINSSISNCYNTGDVKYRINEKKTTSGALIGNSSNSTISNCYNTGYCDGYAIVASNTNSTFTGVYGVSGKCLADAQYSQVPSGCTLRDAVDFASGEIAYLMNGSTSTGELSWYQLLGSDISPVLTPMQDDEENISNIVYHYTNGTNCQGQALVGCYTNNANYKGHSMALIPMTSEIKTCRNPQNFDYYHCTVCDRYFYDILGDEDLTLSAPKAHNLQKYDKVYDCLKGGMLDHYYCEECHNSYSSNAEPETDNNFICQNHYEMTEQDVPLTVAQTKYSGGKISCHLNESFEINGEFYKGGSSVILRELGNSGHYDEFTFTWPETKTVAFKYNVRRDYSLLDYSELSFWVDEKRFVSFEKGNRVKDGVPSRTLLLTGHKPGDKVTIRIQVDKEAALRSEGTAYFYFSLIERPEHEMRQYGGSHVGAVSTCLNNSSDAAHWHCMVCNGNFSDEAGENRIGTSKPHNFTGHHEGGYFFKGDNTTLADGTQKSFADIAEDHHAYIPEYWYCADCEQNFASSNPNSDEARLNFIVQNAQHSLVSEPVGDTKLSIVQCECGYGRHYEYDADKAVIPVTEYDEENNALTFGNVDFTIGDDKKVMDLEGSYNYKAANATLTESWISGRSWGTKFVPFSFSTNDVPELKFYTIKEINLESAGKDDAVIVLNEVSGNVNAGTPLFVQAVDAGITSTTISATDADLYPTGIGDINMMSEGELYPYSFIGVTKARTITKNIKTESYYMAQDMLWHATGSFDVNPYRAYLRCNNEPDDNVVKARAFILVTEDTPGLDRIEAIWDNGEIMDVEAVYDLGGKKLNTLHKGVNVIKLKSGSIRKVTIK